MQSYELQVTLSTQRGRNSGPHKLAMLSGVIKVIMVVKVMKVSGVFLIPGAVSLIEIF